MEITMYKINPDYTYGGAETSHSDEHIDIHQYVAPTGFTFIAPPTISSDIQQAVFNGTSWDIIDKPSPPPEPTLDDLKSSKSALIRAESDLRISMLEEGYTSGEVKTFEQQHSGAVDITQSNFTTDNALFVKDLLTIRLSHTPSNEELITFAQRIISNYNTAKAYTINIIGTQQYLENCVRECQTSSEVEAVPVWLYG